MLNQEEINRVYAELATAKSDYAEEAEHVTYLKASLETFKAKALANGQIDGKNADAREAAAHKMFEAEFSALDDAEAEMRLRKLALDLAQIEVDRVHDLIRYLSIGSR